MPQKSLTMFAFWKKLPYRKKPRSEKGKTSNESSGRSQSLVPKQEKHPEPPAQPNDLWMQAQERLEQNSDLAKILGESVKILESDYGLKLQPGDTSYHQRLRDLLEERKWVIHLGQHSVGVGEQISNISKNVLAIKELVTSAASSSPPASIACAGIIACFSIVLQAAEQHALLLKGLESTSGLVIRLHVMEDLYLNSRAEKVTHILGDFQDTLVSTYSKVLEFQARAVCYVHRHYSSQLLRDIFKWDGWADLLQDLEGFQKSLDGFTSLIGHAELTQGLENLLKTSGERDIWTITSARDERAKKLFNLLYTCPYKDRKDRNSKRVPGTCEWFTSQFLKKNYPKFKDWQRNTNDESPGLLWVSADPGCGKSVLTRYLVDELLLNTVERTVCYFFFKDDFADQRSGTSALSVILRQLFIAQPQLLGDTILDKLDTDGEKLVQSFSELWNILISVSTNSRAGEIICILDALDECQDGDRNQLISAVTHFYLGPHKNSNLKILMTSRPYDHIRRGFWKLEKELPTIHLSGDSEEEVKYISREIDLVIAKRVNDISDQRSLEKDERDMLAQQLTAVENRTYLWVSLTLDVLENIPIFTKGNIRRVMQDLPTTVDSAYEKILNRSSDKNKARVLLHIITAAMRPLSLDELSLALAVSADHKSLTAIRDDVEPKDRFRKTMRDLCGLFVVVIDEKVYLLHQTAKEFLIGDNNSSLNINISKDTRWKHSILPEKSHDILANICTSYITLVADKAYQGVLEERSDEGGYLHYSSCYWSAHFRQTSVREGSPLLIRAQRICDPNSDVYQMWSEIWGDDFPKGATTLLIASYLGLADVVSVLATETVEFNSRDLDGRTALSCAAAKGYKIVVELLLSTGKVDINNRDSDGQTPLFSAVRSGNEAVVELLLATGKVDIDSRNSYGRTPLFWAAMIGNKAVVELLLTTGKVDINNRDLYGQTPLSLAAEFGHEAVVELLLATGKVDIDSRDLYGWTPLSRAAKIGYKALAL
ncbi:hypothetical protein RU639_002115 [Aspergillus parasiticus]